jgi:uncharacterized protein (TIGR02246 family)
MSGASVALEARTPGQYDSVLTVERVSLPHRSCSKMSRFVAVLLSNLLLLSCAACKQAVPPERTHDANVRAIQDAEAQWNQDFASRDVSRLVAHYAEDAVLIIPGEPPNAGPAAIRKTIDRLLADPALSVKFVPTKVEVSTSGDLGYTEGSYTLTLTDPQSRQPLQDQGSYVTTYRKQADGTWKAVTDIATSSVAQGSQAAPRQPLNKK